MTLVGRVQDQIGALLQTFGKGKSHRCDHGAVGVCLCDDGIGKKPGLLRLVLQRPGVDDDRNRAVRADRFHVLFQILLEVCLALGVDRLVGLSLQEDHVELFLVLVVGIQVVLGQIGGNVVEGQGASADRDHAADPLVLAGHCAQVAAHAAVVVRKGVADV